MPPSDLIVIRKLAKQHGLSGRKLAAAAGIDRNTVRDALNGSRTPRPSSLAKMRDYLFALPARP